jgi:hypothetical protein
MTSYATRTSMSPEFVFRTATIDDYEAACIQVSIGSGNKESSCACLLAKNWISATDDAYGMRY